MYVSVCVWIHVFVFKHSLRKSAFASDNIQLQGGGLFNDCHSVCVCVCVSVSVCVFVHRHALMGACGLHNLHISPNACSDF